ncbi:hypothetical protein QRX60_42225 [Amycolatopsis mongoliensis]|uniref:Uncharacterized protein n=1 Tax=Amycolatopsis mongoliensis TaxID=715475 RepID=A0A9Y2JMV6_9PSEU|nr:hypothetical protein [Amycolatopsis sp. 4-36]WIY00610.1 hypothetical protein QRX60_42225 [Amycolatopsis sp. 4-36]
MACAGQRDDPRARDGAVGREGTRGAAAARLGERLSEAASWEERFAMTDAALAGRAEAGPAADPEVAWVWGRLVRTRGLVRVERLGEPFLTIDDLAWPAGRMPGCDGLRGR